MDDAQPQVRLERVEIAVDVEQLMAVRNGEGGDEAVVGLAAYDA